MDFKHVQAILWDLDNTLYRFTDRFIESCNEAAAKTFCILKPDLSYEEALDFARRSYAKHKFSGHIFMETFGFRYEEYHYPFHENISPETTIHNPDTLQALASLTHMEHRVVTNSSRHWANTMLNHIGLSDFFDPEHIVTLEDSDFVHKASGPNMIHKACEGLSCTPQNIAMVDDLFCNHKHAKALGLTTILVHPHDDQDYAYDFIDHTAQTLEDLIPLLQTT